MTKQEEMIYIQDLFKYLVCHVGTCVAIYVDHGMDQGWQVHLNGRLFTETRPDCSDEYHFACKTEHGTVKVKFARAVV